jgi:hypothetical protein
VNKSKKREHSVCFLWVLNMFSHILGFPNCRDTTQNVVFSGVRKQIEVTAVNISFFFFVAAAQRGPWPPHSWGFLDHTQWRATFGRTPLDEWSARRRDLYLTKHNRQTSMTPVRFEPTISAGERPQNHALDRAATGIGKCKFSRVKVLHYEITSLLF